MTRLKNLLIISLFLFNIPTAPVAIASNEVCRSWFKKTGISAKDKSCNLKCSSSATDMGTFDCPQLCEVFCAKEKPKCPPNDGLKKKIQQGLPPRWSNPFEKHSPFSENEKEAVYGILSRIPKSFELDTLEGIFKIRSSRDLSGFGAEAAYEDKQLVLYQTAFDQPQRLPYFIIHELAHHLHETSLKKEFLHYKKKLKWNDTGKPRPGPFIDSTSKDSAEEDFARNFENYILNPEKLKSTVPEAYKWMNKSLGKKFHLKECDQ